jgi:hypothetical protein
MIIGNKCDMEDKRVIATERGQEVDFFILFYINKLELLNIFIARLPKIIVFHLLKQALKLM